LRKAGIDLAKVKTTTSTKWTIDQHPITILSGVQALTKNWECHFEPHRSTTFEGVVEEHGAQLMIFEKGAVTPFVDSASLTWTRS
jgi:hypothetical protein